LFPLRRRATFVHRQHVCHDGSDPGPGHGGATVSPVTRARPGDQTLAVDYPAAPVRHPGGIDAPVEITFAHLIPPETLLLRGVVPLRLRCIRWRRLIPGPAAAV